MTMSPTWREWAAPMVQKRSDGLAYWRVDHLEHLLNKSDLGGIDPSDLSPKGQSILRWLCGWDADTIEGIAEILNTVVGQALT